MIAIGPFTLLLLVVLLYPPLRRFFGFAIGALTLVLWLWWPTAEAADEGTTIYAIFQCVQASRACTMQSILHVDRAGEYTSTFSTLSDCQQFAQRLAGAAGSVIPADGRFVLGGGSIWYQCLGRHIDNPTVTR